MGISLYHVYDSREIKHCQANITLEEALLVVPITGNWRWGGLNHVILIWEKNQSPLVNHFDESFHLTPYTICLPPVFVQESHRVI